ncbi:TetR/AcrR family transcriptional regulator [Sedimentibacter sp.]|uniref:TetR/AcrR family transcriptional regulator n=1 Tax=Sedimentibacter sp. TaxID=1960295 RepID=UPI0028AAE8F1|nr:TetR/AcrR family transcriptional regulator [Sedimentibacter sp.]
MARSADKHDDKKRELLSIAEKLFMEKGYQKTSLDDILRASGISKGGFYHYFKSKDEVLSESINNMIDEVLAILQKVVDEEKLGALDKLNLFLSEKSKFQSSKAEYAKLLGVLMQTDVSQYIYYVTVSRKLVTPLAQIIRQGVNEGIFDVQFPEETADILTRIINSVMQSAPYLEYLSDAEKHKRYVSSVQTMISRTLGLKAPIKLY